MALALLAGSPGAPWERPLQGRFEQLVVESSILRDNPLGDPTRRPLYVYVSPGAADGGVPAVYMLQGYGGQLDAWLARKAFEPTAIERLDAMFASGGCPDAIVVFVDAWTSLGGSQFINSDATGRYMDYLCDEVVPFAEQRYGTLPVRNHRGVAGHSSGGYGAAVTAMLRPDAFGAFASQAGDALFECCYVPDFRAVVRTLRDHFEGSFEVFLERFREAETFDWTRYGGPMSVYAMAAAYSSGELPFSVQTGELIDGVWQKWLRWDPVRMARAHVDALRSMRRIYLDAGRRDEFFLDLGAQAFSAELTRLEVDHTLELFDGGHTGTSYRDPRVVAELVRALG